MGIRILKQNDDVEVSEPEYRKHLYDYRRFCQFYCGIPPSLEEYIRMAQRQKAVESSI